LLACLARMVDEHDRETAMSETHKPVVHWFPVLLAVLANPAEEARNIVEDDHAYLRMGLKNSANSLPHRFLREDEIPLEPGVDELDRQKIQRRGRLLL